MVTGTRLADVQGNGPAKIPASVHNPGTHTWPAPGVFLSALALCGQGIRDHPPEW